MRKNGKRIFIILLSAVLSLSCFSLSANAKVRTILSLGDSISAGYGLSDVEKECFIYGISQDAKNVINMAISGNTAEGILNQINDEKHQMHVSKEKFQNADVVTITCGGNDMMAVLYEKIVSLWNKANPNNVIELKDIPSKMASGNIGLLMYAVSVLNPESDTYLMTDESFRNALDDYIKNLKEITAYINRVNPRCAVIVATQYNPYVEFAGTNFDVVYKGMKGGVDMLNEAIVSNADEGGYMVSDVKALFDSYDGEGDLYNADVASMNVDFHPTAEGHKLIAESFGKSVSEIKYVNYSVYHYYEKTDGSFEEDVRETKAVKGVNITAVPLDKSGFSVKAHEDEIKTVKASEGAVLKLYYFRNTYSVVWHTFDDVKHEQYKYGDNISEIVAERKGYKFIGWDKEVPETMPAYDMTFVARWEEKGNGLIIGIVVSLILLSAFATLFIHHIDDSKKSKIINV